MPYHLNVLFRVTDKRMDDALIIKILNSMENIKTKN